MKRFKNILLLMNDTDEQNSAFQRAVTLAAHNQAKLTVFEVLEDFADFHHLFDRIRPHEIMENMVKEKLLK